MDILTGGPWTALANTQLDFLTLIQNAEICGIYGISFWIVLINILLDIEYPSGFQQCSGERNLDGNLDVMDIVNIVDFILGD